ncbi:MULTISPECIES: DUF4432 family protein [Rhizobium]|uniref:DUF4432 domain-containing protein n=1 Tax=Rhizobium favelukesii TaxID=348824 RepID=W6RC69_9HYPH|nr:MULTISPECIES: DUF4432 family protein [Rhizobium]MCA0802447.1 DUF4432 family protein [Rhizobium sp. T1473]MCS0457741.1 DUF4432 family protein [Rhizobium favelukesii]UFS83940.1 DUF4432 family protein [Rhizobium sp. T136]CDM58419.1 hypothetical protein LPU83_2767 [Rhizobium favelukesii]
MIEFAAAAGPKLMLDETSLMDIGACVINGVDIAPKEAVPDDGDARISHSVQGFLFTCGPDHIRHREPIPGRADGKVYPLHGSAPGHVAKILWTKFENGNAECRADIDVVTVEGLPARIERHWLIDGGTGEVSLKDKVVNTSDEIVPAFLMYHMNIGGKWFDAGTRLEGKMLDGGGFPWNFGEEPGGIFCVEAPATEGGFAEVRLGPIAAIAGKALRVRVLAETLPHLQVWRNQKAPADVLGIEPVSHRWLSRFELETAGEFIMLKPGESRNYALSFAFV